MGPHHQDGTDQDNDEVMRITVDEIEPQTEPTAVAKDGKEKDPEKDSGKGKNDSPIVSADPAEPNYDKFPEWKKRVMVYIVAYTCFLSPMSNMAFLPAVAEIASDFHTTGTIINVSNAVYCIFMAGAPCIWSPFSDIYGRRWTFILCAVMFTVTTVCVVVSVNLAMFFVFRAISALFGTACFSVGASIVGDIYPPVKRGTAMGVVLLGAQIGPTIGPVLGGIIVTYASWRYIFVMLAGLGVLSVVASFFFLPETGGDNLKYYVLRRERGTPFVFPSFNPFRVMRCLYLPSLLLAGYSSMTVTYNMYTLLTPIRYIMDARFKLTTPLQSSLFYLPPGFGYIVGSQIGGRWADHHVKKYMRIRGQRIPEDRLRSTIIASGLVMPAAAIILGWCLDKDAGGMAMPIIALFFGGVAQTVYFPSINAYCVECVPELKGDVIGSNYFVRYISAAVGTATTLIQIETIGVGWTCTISSFVLWTGFASILALIFYGQRMRAREKSILQNWLI